VKSLNSLIAIGLILASPAFASGTMAADVHAKARHVQVSQHRAAPRVAARSRATGTRYDYGHGGPSVDPARIIGGLLASPWVAPYLAQYGGRMRITGGSRGTSSCGSSSFDFSSPSSDVPMTVAPVPDAPYVAPVAPTPDNPNCGGGLC
jgi:hypothetical protein